ncbi:MAG: hypothetical protein UW34_C0001G0025 [Parcubacteria group bacterium GW2011_GWA2_44_15]|nr:MAG: hypothetical protein UW34_C0001G0025 [Parcubacteria group bacterium GW2011_GWA2_44_15]
MEKISFFLEKFKTLGLEPALVKIAFIEKVERILHAKLNPENIKIKDGVLYIKAHPTLKSELYMKRRLFVDELSKILGPMKITGLR